MTLHEAIEIVERQQKWRRGAEIQMTEPKVLGEAIDVVLDAAKKHKKQSEVTEMQINTLALYFAKELGASYQHEFWKDSYDKAFSRGCSMTEAWFEANKALIKHTLSNTTK